MEPCDVKRCRRLASITYYARAVCEHHWRLHTEGARDLKKEFGIVDEPKQRNRLKLEELCLEI